jgi:hypothetical protein
MEGNFWLMSYWGKTGKGEGKKEESAIEREEKGKIN